MVLFRSDSPDAAQSAGAWPAGNPAQKHPIVGAGTTLDGTLTVRERLVLRPTAVFSGRYETGDAPARVAPPARRTDVGLLPSLAPAAA